LRNFGERGKKRPHNFFFFVFAREEEKEEVEEEGVEEEEDVNRLFCFSLSLSLLGA